MKTSSISRAAGTLAVVAGLVAMSAGPASAVVRDVDSVTVNGSHSDFGVGPLVSNHPSSAGTLTWDEATNTAGKPITGRLTGTVWWSDTSSGGCALVRIRMYNTQGATLATAKSVPVCRTGSGAPRSTAVNIAVSSTTVHRMVITTQIAPVGTGPFTNDTSVERFWGQIGALD